MPDALSSMSYDVSNRLVRAESAPGETNTEYVVAAGVGIMQG
jgi:hypothetical protein